MNTLKILALASIVGASALSATADQPEGYYAATAGKKKAELKAAMHNVIRTASVLSYGSGSGKTWSGFYQTDRDEDGYCIDRYSPEMRQFTSTTGAISGMNIEHSFAKSWWGGSQVQAYKDLFNLMPSDQKANSSKSNFAMGEVTNATYTNGSIKVGKGTKISNSIWEPEDKWKGDFARTYMYMVTCYSDLTWTSNGLDQLNNNQWPTFNAWTMEMVLRWSREDPVDDIERARNEAVYEIQGNRNPFVDFPNLCEYVWGDSIEYAFYPDRTSTGGDTPDPGDKPGEVKTLVDEALTDGLGIFADVLPDGTPGSLWRSDSRYGAVANAFKGSAQAADHYLLAEVDLTQCTDATLTFVHQTGFNTSTPVKDTYFSVLITDDYTGAPSTTDWESLDADFPDAPTSGWTKEKASGDISLKAYAGRRICLAFHYTSTTSACYGWEVRNVQVNGTMGTTGIEDISADKEDVRPADNDRVYDLTGRPLRWSEAKGVVIFKGKLYVK